MSGPHPPDRGRLFWPLAVAGWGIMLFGVAGMLRHGDRTHPVSLARWLVGSAIVHDGLIAPLVCVGGLLLSRLVRGRIRPYLQAGLLVTGMLLVAAIPVLGGFGRRPGNPSALPGNYPAGLLVVVGAVWAVVLVLAARSMWSRPRRR